MCRWIIALGVAAIALVLPPSSSAQTAAQREASRLMDVMIVNPYDETIAMRLIELRDASAPLVLAYLDGTRGHWRSEEYRQRYTSAVMMQPPVRRGGQWVQPLVLPMNPANHMYVALCAILTRMGDRRAIPRMTDALMYNLTISAFAGDVLRGYIVDLQSRPGKK